MDLLIMIASLMLTQKSEAGMIQVTSPKQTENYIYTLLSDYGYSVGTSTSVEFLVKACDNAHVALMSKDVSNADIHLKNEVVIGGWKNTMSCIRDVRQGQCRAEVHHTVLNCSVFKMFKLSWIGERVELFTDTTCGWYSTLAWEDTSPLTVKNIGVTTGVWADGEWRILPNQEINTTDGIPSCILASSLSTTYTAVPSTTDSITSTTVTQLDVNLIVSTPVFVSPGTETNTSYIVTTESPANPNTTCVCHCRHISQTVCEKGNLDCIIFNIKQELYLDKTTLSSFKRKKTSAHDGRASSIAMGALGICVILVVLLVIVIPDALRFRNFIRK